MKENITILFFILILAFAGFGVYYYYKNSVVSNILSYGVSNSIGFQVLGSSSDGTSYLAAQVGQAYETLNVSIYVVLDYEGPEPFRVSKSGYSPGIWEYTTTGTSPDPNHNYTRAWGTATYDVVYSTDKLVVKTLQLTGSYVIFNLYQNGTVFKWVIKLLSPPKLTIYTSDAAGNQISLVNSNNCQNPLEITLTLQALMLYDMSTGYMRYVLKVLGIDSAGSGWCPV